MQLLQKYFQVTAVICSHSNFVLWLVIKLGRHTCNCLAQAWHLWNERFLPLFYLATFGMRFLGLDWILIVLATCWNAFHMHLETQCPVLLWDIEGRSHACLSCLTHGWHLWNEVEVEMGREARVCPAEVAGAARLDKDKMSGRNL